MLPLVLSLSLAATAHAQDPSASPARELFLQHCATCHGEAGDGRGVTVLPRPARSFLAGGFSYGNTPTALRRTLENGIPGTPMPGFGATLSEEQRDLLIDYVISLGPERTPVEPSETVLAVEDRAVVVRGFLPPVVEGAPEHPRGLLVGLPTGTTFQYRADDVRLVAVRQGAFVERRDWVDRGGNPLAPQGAVTFLSEGGHPGATFARAGEPWFARLRSTRVTGATASIEYALVDADGRQHARVVETPFARATSVGSGFTRRFAITPAADEPASEWTLDAVRVHGDLQPLSSTSVLDERIESTCAWRTEDGSLYVAHLVGPQLTSLGSQSLAVGVEPGVTIELELTLLVTAAWDAETAATVARELAR